MLAEFSAYEKIFELTSGPKDTKKSVHETSIGILQQRLAFYYSANAYFAEQRTERLDTTAYSLDDLLSKIVDHYNCMKQIGPTKCDVPADKQNDGKDKKKKGDKQAVANPAIKDSATSSKQCQLCSLDHNATEFPLFQELKIQRATKQGELFPGN